MDDSHRALGVGGPLLIVVVAAMLVISIGRATAAAQPQLRGIWMHANFIRTPAEADGCIDKVQRANFNAVFLLVWYWGGQASFQTPLCPMLDGVQPGYDPLQYTVQECRRRKIEVHAWFVNGAYGHPKPLHVLDQHPDWTVDNGGQSGTLWYDLGKPQVRKFQSDLMIEALTRYDLDGIHFDFIRYDGPAMCYCKHCQTEFASRYGCGPIEQLRRASFPFACTIAGNPVAKPTTAKVLAQFSDGTPAIATNELGKGKVLLFNWHAVRCPLPPVVETLSRALRQWNAPRDKVFVMDTAPNRRRYGGKGTSEAAEAFRKLGYQPRIIAEDRLGKLPPGSLVVLADVYLVPDDCAQSLEQFVRGGGLLVVIDGPVHSIRNASIQRVLGMKQTAKYMNRLEVVQPVGASDLLLCEDTKIDLEQIKLKQNKWSEYRKSGVTELVRDVYRRAKSAKPGAQVTAAVFPSLASAEEVFQDWPGWIRQGVIDYVVPMAYTPRNDVLAKQLQEWRTVDPRLERILPGLGIFTKVKEDDCYTPRDVEAILAQYRVCMDQGARGNNFYSLDGTAANPVLLLNEPLIEALRDGPFRNKAPAYRPPATSTAAIGAEPRQADFKAKLLQLCDAACKELPAENRRVPFYHDSYAVRAMAVAHDMTGKQAYLDACKAWSNRMVAHQAKMNPRGAYYMNYGRKPGEDKGEWYVADAASIALGILATAARCPDQADRDRYVNSVKAYADLVIEKYVGPKGGITDGLWSKFDGEWWCSSGVFGSLAFVLYDQTGDQRYQKAALGAVDWLNQLEVRKAQHISFEEAAPTVIMYVYEAYSTALPRLEPGSQRYKDAIAQLKVALDWMAENQAGRGWGQWKYTTQWGSKLGGLPFHMYVWARQGAVGQEVAAAADQELRHISGLVFQNSPPKFDQLAIFSMMSYAEKASPGAIYRKRR